MKCILTAASFAAALTIFGCGGGATEGPETVSVTGVVKLNGEPVEGASVTFSPSGKGVAATAKTDASGAFSAKSAGSEGVVPGSYSVMVMKYEEVAGAAAPDIDDPDYTGDVEEVEPENLLPAKYASKMTSGLSLEVAAGEAVSDFNIELTE